jgi:coenzyme F420-0:L-glutamate ligase / coenzyme F420-1:gamma-L-glutamate ligase
VIADDASVLGPGQRRYLERHRVARLATVDAQGRPHVVPICYAVDGDALYSPLDEKPKTVAPTELRRVRNLLDRPDVAIVVDDYADDWDRLAYLLLRGRATLLWPGDPEHEAAVRLLRAKYPQYRTMAIHQRPAIRVGIRSARGWTFRGSLLDGDGLQNSL